MKEPLLYIAKDKHISIRRQCAMLGVSRSRLYYEPALESQQNLLLMRLMDEQFLDHPTHEVLQMQDFLCSMGYVVNEKRIRRLLRKMGVMAIYPGRNLSRLGQAKYLRPYLLRG